MRVRSSVEAIRNLERLLAFDEAAGSRGMWRDTTEHHNSDHVPDTEEPEVSGYIFIGPGHAWDMHSSRPPGTLPKSEL